MTEIIDISLAEICKLDFATFFFIDTQTGQRGNIENVTELNKQHL